MAKAIILDNAESAWVDSSAESLWRANKALSQAHFDYDNISCGVFANPSRCRIEGRLIRLGQEEYEFVVLPGADAAPVEILRRLREFYEAGGTVISLGPGVRIGSPHGTYSQTEIVRRLPLRSTDGRHDGEVKDFVVRIRRSHASGRGRAYSATYKDLKTLLYAFDAHDVWIDPNLEMLQLLP